MAFLFVLFLIIIFVLLELQPGSIENQFLGNPEIPPEAREILRERLGLNNPTLEFPNVWNGRLPEFIFNFFQLDFGVSWTEYPREVTDILISRLPRTVVLFLTSTLTAYWLGFASGKLVAWRRGTRTEHAVTVTGIAVALCAVFAAASNIVRWGIARGRIDADDGMPVKLAIVALWFGLFGVLFVLLWPYIGINGEGYYASQTVFEDGSGDGQVLLVQDREFLNVGFYVGILGFVAYPAYLWADAHAAREAKNATTGAPASKGQAA